MAIRQVKVSDLDGSEGAEIGVVVRDYPGLDQAKALDVTKEQADALVTQEVKNVVVLELRMPDTTVREVMVSKSNFDKWAGGNAEELLKSAPGLRGRRPGYSPGNGNGH